MDLCHLWMAESMKTQIFTVIPESEHSEFPLDMLRYDTCWPYSQEDVATIQKTFRHLIYNENDVIEELPPIHLKRRIESKKSMPTEDRWKSFGWKVYHVQTI